MNIQKYILPLFVSTNLIGQTTDCSFSQMEFGITHSTFTSICFKPVDIKNLLRNNENETKTTLKVAEINYGFNLGMFLYMPLNDVLVYKPTVELSFSNTCIKNLNKVYATSFEINILQSFNIALKAPNQQGIIYLARDMSCYLTAKQPYLIIGPKINLKKYDNGFLNKGYQNELAFGAIIGYGINYEFHGTNFAPEISYSLTTTAQNKINDSKKVVHTITLALNFF